MKNEETQQMSWDDTPPPSLVGTAKTRDLVKPDETVTSECVGGHQQCEVVVKSIVL